MTSSSVPPVRDLNTLLASMRAELHAGAWAWCTLPASASLEGIDVIATMREVEGLTIVISEAQAVDCGWPIAFLSAWITLAVNSDLAAVGLTAAFARVLADAGIACNVVAGVHHDHLFVPIARGSEAVFALNAFQARFTP